MSGVSAIDVSDADALLRPLARFPHILLAVSGGGDSLALLVLAAEWAAARSAATLSVATVDHDLRPEAAQEIAAVAALSARFGLSHARLAAPLGGAARIEATARDRRYAALVAHARTIGAPAFATAHTLDDQAETVLMRLAAGSGPAGLAAMRPEVVREGIAHLRPLLGVAKTRLLASLRVRGIVWAEDAMNADPAFARARLRAGWGALAREGMTTERLATLAARMARIEDALAAAVAVAVATHVVKNTPMWTLAPAAAAEPAEIRLRVLGLAVAAFGSNRIRLDRLEALAARISAGGAGAATLAGVRIVWRADGGVTVSAAPPRRTVRPPGGFA